MNIEGQKFNKPEEQKASLEHKDISGGERRQNYSYETAKRARAEFFFNLMEESLINYDEANKTDSGKDNSPLQNVEFFFKRSWDKFTEPFLEYEDMLAEIMTKKWESNGAKSRALAELKEQRAKTLENIKILKPDFEELDSEKQRKTIAKFYEEYAEFIHENERKFNTLAEDIGRGDSYPLRITLGTKSDEFLREYFEGKLLKEKRKKESKKARKSQANEPEEQIGEQESEAEIMSPEAIVERIGEWDEVLEGLKAIILEKQSELKRLQEDPNADNQKIEELKFEIDELRQEIFEKEEFIADAKEVSEEGGEFFDRKVEQ